MIGLIIVLVIFSSIFSIISGHIMHSSCTIYMNKTGSMHYWHLQTTKKVVKRYDSGLMLTDNYGITWIAVKERGIKAPTNEAEFDILFNKAIEAQEGKIIKF